MNQNSVPLRTAGILLGIGMGGFFDGILLHQILQVHNMLSNKYFPDTLVNEQINMFWDGMFHAFTWIVTALGIWKFWEAARNKDSVLQPNLFIGSMFMGWGAFNLVEGIIDHEILGLHHVIQRAPPGPQFIWDMLFLGIGGVGLIAFGFFHIRKGQRTGI